MSAIQCINAGILIISVRSDRSVRFAYLENPESEESLKHELGSI